ncbi:MAG TPA: hypothetical protein PLU81_03555 [Deltaproteobacteria bacterium]|nr:hypothetical protein [Deltaproteobacteria bacterium]
MNDSFDQLIEKLMANETAISGLYRQFAETFPQDADFWKSISQEELMHASWIEKLRDVEQKGEIGQGTTTIRVTAIESSIKYIDSLTEKCRRGEIERVNAFALAYDIENSLLEKKFLSVFAFGSGTYKGLSDKLVDETKQHIEKISAALASIKSGPRHR